MESCATPAPPFGEAPGMGCTGWLVREGLAQPPSTLGPGPPPKLVDRVSHVIRLLHYSRRTEEAYLGWIRRFILFRGKCHPMEMGGSVYLD